MPKIPIVLLAAAALMVSGGAAWAQSSSGSTGNQDVIPQPDISKTPPGVPEPRGQGAGNNDKSPAPPMSLPPGGPANSPDIMFEPNVPNWNAGEERERIEARMKADIEAWQEQVARFSTEADERGTPKQKSAARQLERAWRAVEQNWQKVRQTTQEDHWKKARSDFESSIEEIARLWAQVERDGQIGARSKN